MTALPKTRLTVDQYLALAMSAPGRYELVDGEVHAMSPEGVGHAKIKFAVQTALAAFIRARALPCHMLPDGMTVRVAKSTAFEPDALVYCGKELVSSAVEVPSPVIVVEVLSPSTGRVDATSNSPAISSCRASFTTSSSIPADRSSFNIRAGVTALSSPVSSPMA